MLVIDLRDGGDLVAHADERQPEAEDDQPGEQVLRVARVGTGLAEQEQSDDADRRPRDVCGAGADPRDELRADDGGEDGGDSHRHEVHAGVERAVVVDLLQVQRGDEEHPEERGAVERERGGGHAEPAGAEQVQRDEGVDAIPVLRPGFERSEGPQCQGHVLRQLGILVAVQLTGEKVGELPEQQGVTADLGIVLDQAVHEREQAGGAEHGAGEVEAAAGLRAPALGDEARRRDQPEERDRDVHEEDPLPPDGVDQHAPGDDAQRAADRRERAPDAERDVALAPGGEHHRHERQRGGREQRGADALHGAHGDEHPRGGREPAGE